MAQTADPRDGHRAAKGEKSLRVTAQTGETKSRYRPSGGVKIDGEKPTW